MNETYLEAGRRGKNTWPRYLLGVVFILFMWFVVGGRASLALGSLLDVSAEQIAKVPSSAGLIAGYLVLSASFPFFLLGTLLAVALIHRRNPLTLVTGRRALDWRRVGTGFGVLFVLVALSNFVEFLVYPSSFSLGPSLAAFVPFALLALVFTPIQTISEDLFFRGYLVQASSLISSNFLFLAVTSGVLSMLPHLLANPEVDAGFLLVALYYFGFGAFIAWVSLRDGTLELAIGAPMASSSVFWNRSVVYGLVLINAIVLIKLAWSFYFGDTSGGLTLLPSQLLGLAVMNAVILYVRHRMRKRSLPKSPQQVSTAARSADGSSSGTPVDGSDVRT